MHKDFGKESDTLSGIADHDSCHLKESLGVAAEPRALLRTNSKFRFIEMPEPDSCCGMGGGFSLEFYDISSAIGRRKRGNIVASGCATVATGCHAYTVQIADILSRAGGRTAVRHKIEIYREAVKGV